MGQYLNIGNNGFESIVRDQYVDKTGLISFINSTLGTKRKMTCVSRPRRFGKSFAAQMLCAYYDKSCDSHTLFDNLQISTSADYRKYLNKYDVIYLDMTEFIFQAGENGALDNIIDMLQNQIIKEVCDAYPDVDRQDNLPKMLYAVAEATGSKFIFIIDEWDAFFREDKYNHEFQDKYIRLLRALFKNSGKTDKMIEAAYITGILPIKKYGTQSAMTDFNEYTMLQPEPIEEYMGFTDVEVRKICEESKVSYDDLKEWYDGYHLGEHAHIYNPKSVVDAVFKGRVGNYWTQSETYDSLRLYIDMNYDGLKEDIIQMIGGNAVKVDVHSFQNDMVSIRSKDDVLTLLIHLGYLAYDQDRHTISIPNKEVKSEFLRAVKNGKRVELVNLIKQSELLLYHTLEMHEEVVAQMIQQVHMTDTAPIFYNNEQALRSVVIFAYISAMDDYRLIQEFPGGKGYADIVFIPKKEIDKPAIIIELKWNKSSDLALDQLKEREYYRSLKDLASNVIMVGIAYDDKSKIHSCKIEKIKL